MQKYISEAFERLWLEDKVSQVTKLSKEDEVFESWKKVADEHLMESERIRTELVNACDQKGDIDEVIALWEGLLILIRHPGATRMSSRWHIRKREISTGKSRDGKASLIDIRGTDGGSKINW